MAGEIALDAYAVQLVPESRYMQAVAVTSATAHIGYVLAAEGGELALATGASYIVLFWMSLVTVLLASILTLALPSPLQAVEVPDTLQQQVRSEPRHSAQLLPLDGMITHVLRVIYSVALRTCRAQQLKRDAR